MQTITRQITQTVVVDEVDMIIHEHEGVYYLAQQERDSYCDYYDADGVGVLTFDGYNVEPRKTRAFSWTGKATDYDNMAYRVLEAANAYLEYDSDGLEALAKRGVCVVAVADWTMQGYPVSAKRLTSFDQFSRNLYGTLWVAESYDLAMGYAKEQAALVNGYTWVRGSIKVDDVDDIEMLNIYDCDDTCHGFTFQNIDEDGDSTPTLEELIDY